MSQKLYGKEKNRFFIYLFQVLCSDNKAVFISTLIGYKVLMYVHKLI